MTMRVKLFPGANKANSNVDNYKSSNRRTNLEIKKKKHYKHQKKTLGFC